MKQYKKVKMQAKNAPSGAYAAGCPTDGMGQCRRCERTS